MAITIKVPLNENELAFMKLWKEKVLPNKFSINMGDVDQAAALVKFNRTGTCSACNRNDVVELNNLYNRLLSQYESYLTEVKRVEDEVQAAKNLLKKKELSEQEALIETSVQNNTLKTTAFPKNPGKEKKTSK